MRINLNQLLNIEQQKWLDYLYQQEFIKNKKKSITFSANKKIKVISPGGFVRHLIFTEPVQFQYVDPTDPQNQQTIKHVLQKKLPANVATKKLVRHFPYEITTENGQKQFIVLARAIIKENSQTFVIEDERLPSTSMALIQDVPLSKEIYKSTITLIFRDNNLCYEKKKKVIKTVTSNFSSVDLNEEIKQLKQGFKSSAQNEQEISNLMFPKSGIKRGADIQESDNSLTTTVILPFHKGKPLYEFLFDFDEALIVIFKIVHALQRFYKRLDKDSRYERFAHCDLAARNIMYDSETGEITIYDYDCAKKSRESGTITPESPSRVVTEDFKQNESSQNNNDTLLTFRKQISQGFLAEKEKLKYSKKEEYEEYQKKYQQAKTTWADLKKKHPHVLFLNYSDERILEFELFRLSMEWCRNESLSSAYQAVIDASNSQRTQRLADFRKKVAELRKKRSLIKIPQTIENDDDQLCEFLKNYKKGWIPTHEEVSRNLDIYVVAQVFEDLLASCTGKPEELEASPFYRKIQEMKSDPSLERQFDISKDILPDFRQSLFKFLPDYIQKHRSVIGERISAIESKKQLQKYQTLKKYYEQLEDKFNKLKTDIEQCVNQENEVLNLISRYHNCRKQLNHLRRIDLSVPIISLHDYPKSLSELPKFKDALAQLIQQEFFEKNDDNLTIPIGTPIQIKNSFFSNLQYQLVEPITFIDFSVLELDAEQQSLLNRLICQELKNTECRKKNKFRLLPGTLYKIEGEAPCFVVLSHEISMTNKNHTGVEQRVLVEEDTDNLESKNYDVISQDEPVYIKLKNGAQEELRKKGIEFDKILHKVIIKRPLEGLIAIQKLDKDHLGASYYYDEKTNSIYCSEDIVELAVYCSDLYFQLKGTDKIVLQPEHGNKQPVLDPSKFEALISHLRKDIEASKNLAEKNKAAAEGAKNHLKTSNNDAKKQEWESLTENLDNVSKILEALTIPNQKDKEAVQRILIQYYECNKQLDELLTQKKTLTERDLGDYIDLTNYPDYAPNEFGGQYQVQLQHLIEQEFRNAVSSGELFSSKERSIWVDHYSKKFQLSHEIQFIHLGSPIEELAEGRDILKGLLHRLIKQQLENPERCEENESRLSPFQLYRVDGDLPGSDPAFVVLSHEIWKMKSLDSTEEKPKWHYDVVASDNDQEVAYSPWSFELFELKDQRQTITPKNEEKAIKEITQDAYLFQQVAHKEQQYSDTWFYGYSLVLMSEDTKPEEGKFYVRMANNDLEYCVIDPNRKNVTGTIEAKELAKILEKEEIDQLRDFELEKLKPFLSKILRITSERGHTHPNSNHNRDATVVTNKDGKITSLWIEKPYLPGETIAQQTTKQGKLNFRSFNYGEALTLAIEALATLRKFREQFPNGVHANLHPGNAKWCHDQFSIFDFGMSGEDGTETELTAFNHDEAYNLKIYTDFQTVREFSKKEKEFHDAFVKEVLDTILLEGLDIWFSMLGSKKDCYRKAEKKLIELESKHQLEFPTDCDGKSLTAEDIVKIERFRMSVKCVPQGIMQLSNEDRKKAEESYSQFLEKWYGLCYLAKEKNPEEDFTLAEPWKKILDLITELEGHTGRKLDIPFDDKDKDKDKDKENELLKFCKKYIAYETSPLKFKNLEEIKESLTQWREKGVKLHLGILEKTKELKPIRDLIKKGLNEKQKKFPNTARRYFEKAKAKWQFLQDKYGIQCWENAGISLQADSTDIIDMEKFRISMAEEKARVEKIRKTNPTAPDVIRFDNFVKKLTVLKQLIAEGKTQENVTQKLAEVVNSFEKLNSVIEMPEGFVNNNPSFFDFCKKLVAYEKELRTKGTEIRKPAMDSQQLAAMFEKMFSDCRIYPLTKAADIRVNVNNIARSMRMGEIDLDTAQIEYCKELLKQLSKDIKELQGIVEKYKKELESEQTRYEDKEDKISKSKRAVYEKLKENLETREKTFTFLNNQISKLLSSKKTADFYLNETRRIRKLYDKRYLELETTLEEQDYIQELNQRRDLGFIRGIPSYITRAMNYVLGWMDRGCCYRTMCNTPTEEDKAKVKAGKEVLLEKRENDFYIHFLNEKKEIDNKKVEKETHLEFFNLLMGKQYFYPPSYRTMFCASNAEPDDAHKEMVRVGKEVLLVKKDEQYYMYCLDKKERVVCKPIEEKDKDFFNSLSRDGYFNSAEESLELKENIKKAHKIAKEYGSISGEKLLETEKDIEWAEAIAKSYGSISKHSRDRSQTKWSVTHSAQTFFKKRKRLQEFAKQSPFLYHHTAPPAA